MKNTNIDLQAIVKASRVNEENIVRAFREAVQMEKLAVEAYSVLGDLNLSVDRGYDLINFRLFLLTLTTDFWDSEFDIVPVIKFIDKVIEQQREAGNVVTDLEVFVSHLRFAAYA